MKLDMQVGDGLGHIVLDGDSAPSSPSPKRGHSPHFLPMTIVAKLLDASAATLSPLTSARHLKAHLFG